ncbi:hypothetical protein TNCV_4474911 [Trichonephila clavipes]|nr:hypothetical protein TNCV_4474911 [Trichonephila clavipes]
MPSPVQSIVMLTTPLQTGSTVLSGQWDTHNRRRTSNTTSPCRLLHIPVVLNDFHSRETTLQEAIGYNIRSENESGRRGDPFPKKSIEKTVRLHKHHNGIHILAESDEMYD